MGKNQDIFGEDIKITYIGESNQNAFLPVLGEELSENEVALGALQNSSPVGVIVFSLEGKSSQLRFVFVEESCRGRGLASILLVEATAVLQEVGVEDLFCYYEGQKDITSFLTKNGGVCLPSSNIYSLPVAELLSSNQVKKISQRVKEVPVMSFRELSPTQWKNCQLLLANHPSFDVSLLEPQNYQKELSFVYMENDKPQSMLLVNSTDSDDASDYFVTLALSLSEERLPIFYVFQAFYELLKSKNQNGTISFLAYNPQIIQHLNDWIGHPIEEHTTAWSSYFDLRNGSLNMEK